MDLRDLLSIEHPVLQAGLAAGVAGEELAGAVSNAGGLGTVGFTTPQQYEREIARTRSAVQGKPYAANLLMPFVRRAHVEACLKHKVPVVTLFFGLDAAIVRALRDAGTYVIYQVGTTEEAERVVDAGAHALIVQGFEAGGHIRGTERLATLFPKVRDRFSTIPVIAAGGIWDCDSTAKARSMGADGVSCGTRFLMTHESRAHPAYKQRLVEASSTTVTTLFGLGWPANHRVLANPALSRWCDSNGQPEVGIRMLNWLSQFGARFTPLALVEALAQSQRLGRPFFTPQPLVIGMDPQLLDVTAAYAGECVGNIADLSPAAQVVAELGSGMRK